MIEAIREELAQVRDQLGAFEEFVDNSPAAKRLSQLAVARLIVGLHAAQEKLTRLWKPIAAEVAKQKKGAS